MLLQKELAVAERSYYEASVKRPAPRPPLTGRIRVDTCVIGAGYAGLSAACELAKAGQTVSVLEAQRVGWGASGRNGGQVLVGFGEGGECAIERQLAPADARRVWDVSVAAVALLKSRVESYADVEFRQGHLSVAVNNKKFAELCKWANHVQEKYEYTLEELDTASIRERVASTRFFGGIYDARSGHLHPLKYCLALAADAERTGAVIYESSPALRIESGANPVVQSGLGEVQCSQVVLAGNVYLGEYGDHLAPAIRSRIMPVGTYIIATQQMEAVRAARLVKDGAAVSDNNYVLDYFRVSKDHRLLFGGGDSFSRRTPRNLIERLRRRMLGTFPQLSDLQIEYSWGGFADVTMNQAPHFGRLGSNVYFLQGFSGHGVAMAGMAGKLVAEAVMGDTGRFDLFARLRHLPFPGGPALRTPALVLAMWYFRLRDML
ncbi:MAG: FAD-binding oxidoreductase [Bradyrhizobium sp.]|nr:FAD-binding oxidoreductase [Bradyrhizobium sp.]